MARVNIYLPDELAERARASDVNVSAIAQDALRRELEAMTLESWLDGLHELGAVCVTHDAALSALDEARDEFGTRG